MTLAKKTALLLQRRWTTSKNGASPVEFSLRHQRLEAETCSRRLQRFLSSARPLPEEYPDDTQDPPLRARFSKRRPPSPPLVLQSSSPVPLPRKTAQETFSIVEDETQSFTVKVKSAAGLPSPTDSVLEKLSERTSPTSIKYTGDTVIPITSVLEIIKPQDDTPRGIWPVFRLMVSAFLSRNLHGFV